MIEIRTGDFRELARGLDAGSVDLVLTDPPYPKEYLPLWDDLGRVAARVLKPGAFLVSYSGKMYLPVVMGALGAHLSWYWLGCLHHNGPKKRAWPHNILEAMKPILVYQKSAPTFKRQPRRFVDLVDSTQQSKLYHEWGQSVAPVMRLLETFTRPGDLVLDPMVGGGTTCVAALQTGRSCIGFEVNPVTADVARARVATAQLPLFVPGAVAVQAALW